jgi:hypothetical protein
VTAAVELYTTSLARGLRTLILEVGAPSVVIGPLQLAKVADVVGITPYPIDDNSETGEILTAVQVRIRGSVSAGTQPVLDLQEVIWHALCMPESLEFNNITVIEAWRQMSAPLGLDPQGRPEVADTYYLRSDRLGRSG